MGRKIIIAPEAADEISESYDWYEVRETGLGERFFQEVRRAILAVEASPQLYPIRFDQVRRIMLRKFPFAVYFEHDEQTIYVHSVFHEAKNPSRLDRLKYD